MTHDTENQIWIVSVCVSFARGSPRDSWRLPVSPRTINYSSNLTFIAFSFFTIEVQPPSFHLLPMLLLRRKEMFRLYFSYLIIALKAQLASLRQNSPQSYRLFCNWGAPHAPPPALPLAWGGTSSTRNERGTLLVRHTSPYHTNKYRSKYERRREMVNTQKEKSSSKNH